MVEMVDMVDNIRHGGQCEHGGVHKHDEYSEDFLLQSKVFACRHLSIDKENLVYMVDNIYMVDSKNMIDSIYMVNMQNNLVALTCK